MKKLFLFLALKLYLCLTFSVFSQTPFLTTVEDITLVGGPGSGSNRSGVAYNPALDIYYGNIAGNPSYSFETFSNTGVLLSSVVANIDIRGLWWNPLLNQLECNTYSGEGIYQKTLDVNGYATATNVGIQTPTNVQPNTQSFGQYDWVNNHFVYYNAGSIVRVNRATNTIVSTNAITGLPATTITDFSVGFFNVPNYELALYDYTNRRVYFVNGSTYAYTHTTQLPMTAINTNWFNVAWANNRIFLCNTSARTWTGYPLFPDGCDTVFYEQVVNVCSNDMPLSWNGKVYNTPGDSIDRFTWPAASVSCDSVTFLTLRVLPAQSSSVVANIYEGDAYEFNGRNLTYAGEYKDVFTAANGCDSTVELKLNVIPVKRTFIDTTICAHDKFNYYNNVYNTQNLYVDTFIFSDHHEILMLNLKVRQRPNISVEIEGRSWNDLCIGEELLFMAKGAEYYEWFKIEEPTKTRFHIGATLKGWAYDSLTHFMVKGYDDLGCFNEYYYDLTAKNCCQYFIPTAFTPNGDGLNDEFQVRGFQPQEFKLLIFNRLGQLIYQSSRVDEGWDGFSVNGEAYSTDVYFYHIQGRCFDGTVIDEKGDLTLIR